MRSTKLAVKSKAKSFFTPVWEEVKRPTNLSFSIVFFYKFISTIQIVALMLEISTTYFYSTSGTWSNILSVPRAFTFRKKFTLDSPDSVTNAFFILSFIAALLNYLLILGTIIGTKLRSTGPNLAALLMRKFMLVHQFILFLPIQVFMLEIIDAYSHSTLQMFSRGGNHAIIMAIAIIVLIFNFLAVLFNIRCYSSLYSPKTYSKRNTLLSFIDIVYKSGMSIYLVFVESSSQGKWIAIFITLIYCALHHYAFHSQLPFFQIKVLESYCILVACRLDFGILLLIIGIFDEFSEVNLPDLPIAGFFVCLPISIAAQFHCFLGTIARASTLDDKNYKTESDVFIRIAAIRYLIKKGTSISFKNGRIGATKWNLKLNGVVTQHNLYCTNETCSCRAILGLDEGKGIQGMREKFKDFKVMEMKMIYEKGLETAENRDLILLNLAQYYLLYFENYLKSYLVLQQFEKIANKSFETEMYVEYLKKRIQEKMELKLSGGLSQANMLQRDFEENNLNVTAVVQNDIQFIQLKNLVHEQVIKQLKFWEFIEDFELNTRQIELCCEEVDTTRTKIERLWDSLSLINQKCNSHYLLYGLYQTLVNNSTKKGEKYLSDYTRMTAIGIQENEAITNDNLYDAQTVIIRISMKKDKIEIIEESSGDVEKIFGYKPSELLGTKVGCLMPPFFSVRHYNFVTNHFEKGTENALNKIKRLFGYHKDGHIFPIFLYISIYPNIETGLSYMGIIRPRKVYNNYILVNPDGSIDSYSPEIADYLGLESRKKYNISELCPDFEKINNAFNYVTRKKHTIVDDEALRYENSKKSAEYQVRITNAAGAGTSSQKGLEGGETQVLNPSQKEYSSITSDYEAATESQNKAGSLFDYSNMGMGTKQTSVKGSSVVKTNPKARNAVRRLRRLNTEEMEEYQRVYDNLSINGSILNFVSQREKLDGTMRKYLCTVSDEIFDYSILRIITLGRNDENNEMDKDTTENNFKANFKPFQLQAKARSLALESILNDLENDNVGISKMPRPEDLQLYKNPFQTEEEAFNVRTEYEEKQNKEHVLNLLLQAPEEAIESHIQLSSGRNDFIEFDHPMSSRQETQKQIRTSNSNVGNEGINGKDDSKGFIQEMLGNGEMGHHMADRGPASTTNASSKSGGVIYKLESLFYKKETNRSSNKLRAYYLIILACIFLGILNVVLSISRLSQGSDRVQRVVSIGDRISYMLNLNLYCRLLSLSQSGYIQANRHLSDVGITDYIQTIFNLIKPGAEDLLEVNRVILNDLDNLSDSSQAKLWNPIEILYPSTAMSQDNIETLNSFDAVNVIANSALQIYSGTVTGLTDKMDQINYILLNSANGVYLEMISEYNIYQNDLNNRLSTTTLLPWMFGLIALTIYSVFFSVLVRDLAKNHQDKIRFWNSLVKLDTVKSIGHKKFLSIIKENLESSSNNEVLKKTLIETKKFEYKQLQSVKEKSKQLNMGFKKLKSYRFQNRSHFIVLPFIIILAVILTKFIVIAVLVGKQGSVKKEYLEEIKQTSSYYNLNLITGDGVYQLVQEGDTNNFQGANIEDALAENLEKLSKLADFIGLFKAKYDFDPRAFIQRDFCQDYTSASRRALCYSAANGINTHGLSGGLTYAKDTFDLVVDFITSLPRTSTNIQNALDQDNLIALEIEGSFINNQFEALVENLAAGERRAQSQYKTTSIIILVFFILLLLGLNYLLIWRGFRRLDRQKFDNMKILRLIPVTMILDSKMLKTYLLKSFKEDLSSVANKL